MLKLLVVTHKQIYFSQTKKKHSSLGGFSTWHNYLSNYVDELHILSPVTYNVAPLGVTYLYDRIAVHSDLSNGTNLFAKGMDILKVIKNTIEVVKTHGIDIIVCKTPGLIGSAGLVGSWLLRKPTVLQIVGDDLELNKIKKTHILIKKLNGFFIKFLLILTCSFSNSVIAQSSKIKDNLLKLGIKSKKILVIPETTLDSTFFRKSKETSTRACKIILYIGRLSPEKGLFVLMKAAKILKRSYRKRTPFKLVIIGDGDLKDTLMIKRKKYDLEGVVELKGFVSHNEVINYLINCNIVVLPSLSEGISKVLFEAMAAGKPILSTCAGGIPEVVENGVNGLLVKTNDSLALADALYRLLEDDALASKLGKEGRQEAENYTLERIMPLYVSCLKGTLKISSKAKSEF